MVSDNNLPRVEGPPLPQLAAADLPTSKQPAVNVGKLAREASEIQTVGGGLFYHLREMELLVHRLQIMAPTYYSSSTTVGRMLESYADFRQVAWPIVQRMETGDVVE